MQFFHKLSKKLFLNADFPNSEEFKKKYTIVSLQRGKLFKLVTFVVNFYSLYLDMRLSGNTQIDSIYRQNIFIVHVAALLLSVGYSLIYGMLEKSERYRVSRIAKAAILVDIFLTLSVAAFLSVNSQRYTGNIDAYIMVLLIVALVVPMYPKWVLGIYGVVHVGFLVGLSWFYQNDATIIRQLNSSTAVMIAIVLFFTSYRYNIKNFLNEEMLKEGKATFLKLFEINPFPLTISRFEDGTIQYANHKAMLFYGIQKEQFGVIVHTLLYKNASDLSVIYKMLEVDHKIDDYAVEQVTLSGEMKSAIVNYKLIDFFGEKCILSAVADIAEIKRIESELTIYASTDILTGVLNRRVGMDLLRKKFETAGREKKGLTIGFFDIDDLKAVNDQFGHVEGDALILQACKIIKEELKHNDTVFRYGGDEFVIIFDDAYEYETEQTCRRIREKFRASNQKNHKSYYINASIGVFSYKQEMNLTLEQIIQAADKNMYRNKPSRNIV